MDWKEGDWVCFDLKIGQIKELREDGCATFSDGFCETSGRITGQFRPLTLKNKQITETFNTYYMRLRQIDGEAGFNYPHISQHFTRLALDAIDSTEDRSEPYDLANQFVSDARTYKAVIQGVPLFRPKLRSAR